MYQDLLLFLKSSALLWLEPDLWNKEIKKWSKSKPKE